jgi:hypothetical protein
VVVPVLQPFPELGGKKVACGSKFLPLPFFIELVFQSIVEVTRLEP